MEEGLVVDELRRVIFVELLEVVQDVLLHVLHERFVAPEFSEPLFELLTVAVAVQGTSKELKHTITRDNMLNQEQLDAWRSFITGA